MWLSTFLRLVRIIAFIVRIPLASLHYSYLKEICKHDCQINVPRGYSSETRHFGIIWIAPIKNPLEE